jgi:hypothetical protein
VAVAAREGEGERDTGRVDDQVVLGANRPRSTGLGPVSLPLFSPARGWNRPRLAPTRSGRRRAVARA